MQLHYLTDSERRQQSMLSAVNDELVCTTSLPASKSHGQMHVAG